MSALCGDDLLWVLQPCRGECAGPRNPAVESGCRAAVPAVGSPGARRATAPWRGEGRPAVVWIWEGHPEALWQATVSGTLPLCRCREPGPGEGTGIMSPVWPEGTDEHLLSEALKKRAELSHLPPPWCPVSGRHSVTPLVTSRTAGCLWAPASPPPPQQPSPVSSLWGSWGE